MSQYKVEYLTLLRLSAIAISKHLWRNSNLKDVLKICIVENDLSEEMPLAIKVVMDNFNVPEPAKEELKFVISSMGSENTYQWSEFYSTRKLLATDVSTYLDHVCWTVSGCPDWPATLKSLYFAKKLQKNSTTWLTLCKYHLEDCLNDLWPKLKIHDKAALRIPVPSHFDPVISAYGMIHLNCDTEFGIHEVRLLLGEYYEEAFSLEENMFMYSFVSIENYVSVKHFWELMDENQRERIITIICERIYSDDPNTQKYKDVFFDEAGTCKGNLLVFFLHQLSYYGHDSMRVRILGSGSALTGLLVWPYTNSFMKIFRQSLNLHNSVNCGPIMSHIISYVTEFQDYNFPDVDAKYRRMFYEIWQMIPKNLKSSIDYAEDLQILWHFENIELLHFILRDEELQDRRKDLLKELARTLRHSWIDHDLLLDFFQKVLKSGDELKLFLHECSVPRLDEEMNEDADD